jgi:hypothetical protein
MPRDLRWGSTKVTWAVSSPNVTLFFWNYYSNRDVGLAGGRNSGGLPCEVVIYNSASTNYNGKIKSDYVVITNIIG